ncbi:MAG: hypothetical protein O7J95_04415 [Planctomycetota bacterium]|nr:hypothetical protein [Planctomycetota bacterium]
MKPRERVLIMPRRVIHAIVFVTIAMGIPAGIAMGIPAGIVAAESNEAGKKETAPAKLVARAGDVEIHYVRRGLPEGARRSVRREREVLLSLDAEWRSRVAVAYRRTTLPAGSYRLQVENVEAKKFALVFRKLETPRKNARTKKKGPGRRSGEKIPVDEKNPPAKGSGAKKGPGRGPGKQPPEKLPVLLRLPLREAKAKARSQELELELKPLAKGQRLRVLLRIGGTEYQTHARVVPPAPPKEKRKSARPPPRKARKTQTSPGSSASRSIRD